MNDLVEPKDWLSSLCPGLAGFLKAVPGSLRGHLSAAELVRVVSVAVAAGGGVFGVLEAVCLAAGAIFPAPADAALAVLVLSLILEGRRRLEQGEEPERAVRRRPRHVRPPRA